MLSLFRPKKAKPIHKGGIDAITPGLITGWVQGTTVALTDVRLLVGTELVAQATINQPRADVAEMLGVPGNFGFQLIVREGSPEQVNEQAPQLLALSADGSVRVVLQLLGAKSQTTQRLQQVLAAELRGAIGHFDGLSPDGQALQGWAYRQGSSQLKPLQVWLQVEGQTAQAVRCDQYRPGIASLGHPERCGFSIQLAGLPSSWAGQQVRVTFDAAGQIPLPGAASCSIAGIARGATPLLHPSSGSPYAARLSDTPAELQQSWQAVEQFRQFLDGLEAQINRAEALRRPQMSTDQKGGPRVRKRDQLLRLLGGGS